jgi:hypothetical protein
MSELIDIRSSGTIFQRQLLATVSALALTVYVSSTELARAGDSDRPTIWIELGGQMESVQGTSTPFVSPFMTATTPTPGPYENDIFVRTQRPPPLAFGLEGKATFQPEGSDWVLSAALRYGRSNTNRHVHQQSPTATGLFHGLPVNIHAAPFADARSTYEESHTVVDFSVGKDVGLGAFGSDGMSVIDVGVRFAQFATRSAISEAGRPSVQVLPAQLPAGWPVPTFYNYTMWAHAARSFHGIGPSLSWNASATLVGGKDAGEITFDWGVNGAILFCRQKAKTDHTTQAYHMPFTPYVAYVGYYYTRVPSKEGHGARMNSRDVTVPNLGGFAGLSVKYPNVKFSLGYRADFFFGAVDAGIDARHTKDLGFHGPFASISIGLGG